jgi:hypothetical protein
MHRHIAAFAAALALAVGGSLAGWTAADASAPSSNRPGLNAQWHRLNPDQSNPAPEHERLTCLQGRGWNCHYDKVPEPTLNFHWDSTEGDFHGADITKAWTCPEWFPADVCQNVAQVARGTTVFRQADGSTFAALQELIVANQGGAQTLWVHWVRFGFACPWFPTFDDALAANPFPLPFNGTDWPEGDCLAA